MFDAARIAITFSGSKEEHRVEINPKKCFATLAENTSSCIVFVLKTGYRICD